MSEKCAVILAGGLGTRLRPYTIALPKPLVPIGDYPIMEIEIRQLAQYGFSRIILAVNHQADIIKAYFGDGHKWGVSIEYSLESKPLGTMGPLHLIRDLPDDFLVMNGDILSDINYKELFEEHVSRGELFTISAVDRTQHIDYGVLNINNDGYLCGFTEKPNYDFSVSMGVYVASSDILGFIPENEAYGFDDLMKKLIASGKTVHVRRYDGIWLDIGRPDDYESAIDIFKKESKVFFDE